MNGRPSQRFDDWQQRLSSICGPFDIRLPSSNPSFTGYAGSLDFGGLEVARIQSNVASLARGRRSVAALQEDHAYLILQLEGHQHIVSDGGEAIELRADEIALVDSSVPFEMVVHGRSDNISIHLPRRLLVQRLQRRNFNGKLKSDLASTQLVRALMLRMRDIDPRYQASVVEGNAFRSALLDMLSAALPEPALSVARGQSDALYCTACALIEARLDNVELDAEWVATQISISRRQLYRLFAEHSEVGVARFILDRRLDRAADMLRDSTCATSIAALAQAVGIEDQGHFSRAFRRRFSISPSQFRSS